MNIYFFYIHTTIFCDIILPEDMEFTADEKLFTRATNAVESELTALGNILNNFNFIFLNFEKWQISNCTYI